MRVAAGFHASPRFAMNAPPARACTEACPYEWPSEIQAPSTCFDGQNPVGSPVWADAAVRPYAEFVHVTKFTTTNQPANAMRGGMLSTRAGRRKCSNRQEWSQCVPATSAQARGTHHASALQQRQTTKDRIADTTGGHSGPPLRRISKQNEYQIQHPAHQAMRGVRQRPEAPAPSHSRICASDVDMGALVTAVGGYRAKQYVVRSKQKERQTQPTTRCHIGWS